MRLHSLAPVLLIALLLTACGKLTEKDLQMMEARENKEVTKVVDNTLGQKSVTRDIRRKSDIKNIVDSIYMYQLSKGSLPPGLPQGVRSEICKEGHTSCGNLLSLDELVRTGHLISVPEDPQADPAGASTRYFVTITGSKISATAPDAEKGAVMISR